jgi:peptidoglycan/LPS O-acetylase OafA/YrhL
MSFFSYGDTFNYYISEIGSPCVFIFLLLSGYGVYMSYRHNNSKSRYWVNKFTKIYVPYLLVNILWIMYIFDLSDTTFVLKDIVAFLLMIINDVSIYFDSPMWYMTALLVYYVLFFVIFFLPKINDKLKVFLVIAVGLLMHIIYIPGFVKLTQYIRWVSLAFPMGVLWAYLASNDKEESKNDISVIKKISVLVGGIILLLSYRFVRNNVPFTDDTVVLRNALFAFGVILLFLGISYFWKNERALMVGQLSYIVYLIHEKIIRIGHNFVGIGWFPIWMFVVIIIVIYVVSWGLNKLFEALNTN